VFDFRFNAVFSLLILIIGLISLSHELWKNEMVIYGEKMNNNKYNDGNFKVYSDYLIQDPSKYGIRDTYHKTNQNDVPVKCED
jgi:hypothetical protein